ncbi:MAG: ion channel [Pirellulales bacterium]
MLPFRITNRPPNPNGGAWIFALQLLLVILVPILDDGALLAPLAYVAVLLGVLAVTVYLLGYRRTAATIAAGGAGVLGMVFLNGPETGPIRLLLWVTLMVAGTTTVALTLKTAFAAGVPPVQRIFCGAAGYVMIGFMFGAIHGLVGFLVGGGYVLESGIESDRQIHWADYLWLSFATLTTAGFGDVVSVGPVSSAVSTLEALAGILFPATLIARIASLADSDRRG